MPPAFVACVLVLVDVRTLQPRLEIETAVEKILPSEGRDRELYQRFRERFGNDGLLVVGVVTEDLFSGSSCEPIEERT